MREELYVQAAVVNVNLGPTGLRSIAVQGLQVFMVVRLLEVQYCW